jgi:hypothetical protein
MKHSPTKFSALITLYYRTAADVVRRTLKLNDQIKQLAADLKDEQSCLMFGRGRNYATAMEAALKVSAQTPCRLVPSKVWLGPGVRLSNQLASF